MRKFVFAVAAVAAVVGIAPAAHAQYGTDEWSVTSRPPVVEPGGAVTVEVQGCQPGEDVDIVLVAEQDTVVCESVGTNGQGATAIVVGGTASTILAAPQLPETYTGTVEAATSGHTGTFTVTVVAAGDVDAGGASNGDATGTLPQTGADGLTTTMQIAIGLLAVGLALLVATQLRHRRTGAVG